MKTLLLVTASLMMVSFANAETQRKAETQTANAACSSDASTAGCPGSTLGKGLAVCLKNYKKSHHDYKVSQGCRDAMKTLHKDNAGINAACTADATTAGCPGEKVGKGLLKCLNTYRKAHKGWKISEGCRSAIRM